MSCSSFMNKYVNDMLIPALSFSFAHSFSAHTKFYSQKKNIFKKLNQQCEPHSLTAKEEKKLKMSKLNEKMRERFSVDDWKYHMCLY